MQGKRIGGLNVDYGLRCQRITVRITVKTRTDALSQVKHFAYAQDDQVSQVSYTAAVNPTATVSFTYDSYFGRLASMTDGVGTTNYSYGAIGSVGALQLTSESGPLSGASIAYSYDALGRLAGRTVAGAGAESFSYDAIGRPTNSSGDLGAFTLTYLGQTPQVTQRALTGTTLKTQWSYLTNTDDRRLQQIANTGLSSSNYSNFAFTTNAGSQVTGITETSDVATVYPVVSTQTASINNLNQITSLSGQAYTYDANGNLTADGIRTYAWDAENRLVSISYTAQPGKLTQLVYDGLGRRIQIVATPAGGGTPTTTSYIWCGELLCQARDATNAVIREYFAEGEYVPGTTPLSLYYGVDQIGTVRRVFASNSIAPAYAYDAYGAPLQTTAMVTDVGYAGMVMQADSGLNLTHYRAYEPQIGRWVSRDPAGETTDVENNLYGYVDGDPVNFNDPLGLCRHRPRLPRVWRGHSGGSGLPPFTSPGASEGNGEPPSVQPPNPPCISSSAGPVNIRGGSFSFVLGAGGTFSYGTFRIPSIGATGTFSAGGGSVGYEGFVGGFTGTYDKFGDFNGKSFTLSGAVPDTPFGGSASSNTPTGKQTGYTITAGGGGGAAYTMGGTHVISSNIPICP